ncbi:MAG: gamma-glutamyltransferase family protein [Rhodospirillaceae bacterium]
MVTAPNHLAAQAGLAVLREGGNAIEAALAAAATISVVYPHMCGLGGDAFWLIHEPNQPPIAIDAAGATGSGADLDSYRLRGLDKMPVQGPAAAATVAGAVSGWQSALDISARWGGHLPLSRLLEEAVTHARYGWPVASSHEKAARRLLGALKGCSGFAETFLEDSGRIPRAGALLRNERLAEVLEGLGQSGLDSFYRGEIAQAITADLKAIGSPVTGEDMARHRPTRRRPLTLALDNGVLHNTPPPTQGLTAMMLLAVFRQLKVREGETIDHLHGLIEASKLVYEIRNRVIRDPALMREQPGAYLSSERIGALARQVDMSQAASGPALSTDGDTIWLVTADNQGRAVSYIQSVYHAFGSGVVLPTTGLLWHNRGAAFSLDEQATNPLEPGRKPFHTLSPALARLNDGRVMAYGCMGGDGQPQFQAAVFSRHVFYGQDLQAAVTAPRWVIGRSWGTHTASLLVESRMDPAVVQGLRDRGHDVGLVDPYDDLMGHAGAIVLHPSGLLEGAVDPRSDGGIAAY